LRFDIVTLFPEMFSALDSGISGRALKRGLASINCWNPRDYTQDVHRTWMTAPMAVVRVC